MMSAISHQIFPVAVFIYFSLLSTLSSGYYLPEELLPESGATAAIPGRAVEVPARDYRLSFKVKPPQLGECALKMEGKSIKTCKEKFGGVEIFVPSASTGVDVSRVQTVDDVLTHGMGGIGANIGVLGIAGVGVKVNVAVATQTSARQLTFMSSYEVKRGILTLQYSSPLTDIGPDGALYLSEIELGGNEILMVTMEFESVQKKIEVHLTVTVKILFIKISAKMKYVRDTFKSASNTRILFKSSWRENLDKTYTSLDDAIEEVERIEKMYVSGPLELEKMQHNDEKLHNTYYFAAWKRSPYGEKMNQAVVNSDLEILTEQNTEIQSVIIQITENFARMFWDEEKRAALQELKDSLVKLNVKLTQGIQSYHKLSSEGREELRNMYGKDKAPGYYQRKLRSITGY